MNPSQILSSVPHCDPIWAERGGINDFFRAVEDVWTWYTTDGRTFENVESAHIVDQDMVKIVHEAGTTQVRLTDLCEESRQRLVQLLNSRAPSTPASGS